MIQNVTEDQKAATCSSRTDGQQAAACAADKCFPL